MGAPWPSVGEPVRREVAHFRTLQRGTWYWALGGGESLVPVRPHAGRRSVAAGRGGQRERAGGGRAS
jgi:hypothetical protein